MTKRNIGVWLLVAALAIGGGAAVATQSVARAPHRIAYAELQRKIDRHEIVKLAIRGDDARAADRSGETWTTVIPPDKQKDLGDEALKGGAEVDYVKVTPNVIVGLLQALLTVFQA